MGLLKREGGHVVATDRDIGLPVGIVWVARARWLEDNREAMQRLLRVLDRAALRIREEPQVVARLVAKRLELTEEHVLEVLTKQASWPTNRESVAELLSLLDVRGGHGSRQRPGRRARGECAIPERRQHHPAAARLHQGRGSRAARRIREAQVAARGVPPVIHDDEDRARERVPHLRARHHDRGGVREPVARRRHRGIRQHRRTLRVREDDAPLLHRRFLSTVWRAHPRRWQAGRRSGAGPRRGLPELRSLQLAERARQRRIRVAHARGRRRRAARAVGRSCWPWSASPASPTAIPTSCPAE